MNEAGHATEQPGILARIDSLLFEPHPAISGGRLRQQARYLSILLVIGIPIFIYAQTTSTITEIPLYLIVTKLGFQNSYPGLITPFLVSAFGIFLMRQYYITFPDEILDAARIDGASELMIFSKIILPNSVPAIATLAVLTFKGQWDNLLWPLLVAQSEEMKTIPLYIVRFTAEKHTDEGAMMAVAAIASIPILILFFKLSKYFLGGATVFSVRKG